LTLFVEKRYSHAADQEWTMAPTSLNISLPEALKEFVHERVAEKAYSNPSDYVRALIREDQRRRAEEKLEQLLLEGLESGPPQPVTPEDWRAIRREVQERLSEGRRRDR
jgi:antitoxin ParD1/3/4